jgi:hypothetical protein
VGSGVQAHAGCGGGSPTADMHEGGTEAGLRLSVAAVEKAAQRQRKRHDRHVCIFFMQKKGWISIEVITLLEYVRILN